MLSKPIFAIFLTLSLTIGMPTASQAVLLTGAGTTDFLIGGTTAAEKPELAGVVLEDVITPFEISGGGETLSGTIQNRVVRSDLTGTLTFYWRIRPDSGSGDISAFRIGGFEGFSLDADWRPDGLGTVAPDIARYFGDGSGEVNFLFGDPEVGGSDASGFTESKFFYLETAALNYDMSGEFDLLCQPVDCISDLYSTFAPSIVPVPAAVWLFGSALLGFVGFARKRKIA